MAGAGYKLLMRKVQGSFEQGKQVRRLELGLLFAVRINPPSTSSFETHQEAATAQ
jgi:hypothetical protein